MKKYKIIILFIFNLLIDLAILSKYHFYGYNFSITIPIIMVLSMYAKKESVVYYSIFQGLVQDLSFGSILGVNTLIYYLISYYIFKYLRDYRYSLSYGWITLILVIFVKNIYFMIVNYIFVIAKNDFDIINILLKFSIEVVFSLVVFSVLNFIFTNKEKKRLKEIF